LDFNLPQIIPKLKKTKSYTTKSSPHSNLQVTNRSRSRKTIWQPLAVNHHSKTNTGTDTPANSMANIPMLVGNVSKTETFFYPMR
jgi:hypothetical protein